MNAAATSSQQANAANNQLSSSAAGITNTSNNANFATPQTVNASDGMTANMTGYSEEHLGGLDQKFGSGGDYFDIKGNFIKDEGDGNGIFIQSPVNKNQMFDLNTFLKLKYVVDVSTKMLNFTSMREQMTINIVTHYYIEIFGNTNNLVDGKIPIYHTSEMGGENGVYFMTSPSKSTSTIVHLSVGAGLLGLMLLIASKHLS